MDHIDEAQAFTEAHNARSIAAARAAARIPDPVRGDCEACLDEHVMVRGCGGIMRCTPCRSRWEQRR
ncbi:MULTISPECIES: hypothetical protein [unclassified Sphingomonas]|uniref:hypothetical protein n=1 Tax=unclassified Sphingomonas TaxID=196159 RepID=UPI0022698CBF|nr:MULTISPECIES: hypothetical protein [unclassified Sphingomonas]